MPAGSSMTNDAGAGDPAGVGVPPGDQWVAALAHALGHLSAEVAEQFARRVTAAYQEQTASAQAAADLDVVTELTPAGGAVQAAPGRPAAHRLVVTPAPPGPLGSSFRLRRYGLAAVELSALLPLLESFGMVVVEAVPYQIRASAPSPAVHIDDIGVRAPASPPGASFDPARDGGRLVTALEAVIAGDADLDPLNRLVLTAGLDWHEVVLLRAYWRYQRQAAPELNDAQLDEPLVAWPAVTRALVSYARARFASPGRTGDRGVAEAAARAAALEALAPVDRFEQDRVLRAYLALLDATVRTNWLVRQRDGRARPTVVLKLDSSQVPGLVAPRPKTETWVHGPSVEGIHLRYGPIARGGIRWSDRPDDLRTEVLDLAQAQVKKNAIIVPTGAKGGFVVRVPHPAPADVDLSGVEPRGPGPSQIEAAYRLFIDSLFDVTDNLVGGSAVTPEGIVAHDGEDPYLVVAADRGTATFSDLANEIATRRGFWLGDAFASGGSDGYDHKAMGVTARGAWVAVRRHFHQLDVDVARETIRVAGVGDMSGDVFGNGMLQSPVLALVAAFDHRHIFVDPDPDPARSFAERRRLATLAHSSWDDYDRAVLSAGGGIWGRDAKVVELSAAAQRALGVTESQLSPPQVVSAILRSPVDLLYFGGIGTYVKEPGEPDVEVADHANDGVRVTADEVRARVIAEGGNLAVTQRGRIRYSRRGGRVNADFIDNAAGVATSDREVNLKILLSLAEEAGRLGPGQRRALLAGAEPEVAAAVLRQVDHSVAALNRAVPASAAELDAHEALIDLLEARGSLDRQVEDLPSTAELEVRRGAGAGLIRPELAVLLAYAKSDLAAAIEASSLVSDGRLDDAVFDYFPASFQGLGADLVLRHRLAPQLAATALAGELVDQMGITWTHETAAELGRSLADVGAAFWAARRVTGAADLWGAIEDLAGDLTAEDEARAHSQVADAVAALARRYLAVGEPTGLAGRPDAAASVAGPGRAPGDADPTGLAGSPDAVAGVAGPRPASADLDTVGGLPADLGRRLELLDAASYLADAPTVARSTGLQPSAVVETFARLDRAVAPGLIHRLQALRPRSRWAAWHGRALVDDLVGWRARAVAGALADRTGRRAGQHAGLPEAAVAAWVAAHRSTLARVAELTDALDPGREDVWSVASLLVRTLTATAP